MNHFTKDDLYRLYVIRGMPMHEVAKELNVAVGTIYNYLHKYGIPTREPHKGALGMKHTEEAKARISKAHKGKKVSDATRAKMSESAKEGGIGHKKKRNDGYISIYFPDHPRCSNSGYIMEHVLVMECLIGRHLQENEVVHHINRIRDDNRKENLQLMTFKEHARLHMIERYEKKKGGMTY